MPTVTHRRGKVTFLSLIFDFLYLIFYLRGLDNHGTIVPWQGVILARIDVYEIKEVMRVKGSRSWQARRRQSLNCPDSGTKSLKPREKIILDYVWSSLNGRA
jgi:hypothetical protein